MHTLYKFLPFTITLLFACSACFAQKDKDKPVTYDEKILFGGCWFTPHNSEVNIRFSEYSNFSFHDIDSNGREQIVNGKYLLDGHNLWLIFNDRPKQKFYFFQTEGADHHYVIHSYPLETGKYYFVHGNCD